MVVVFDDAITSRSKHQSGVRRTDINSYDGYKLFWYRRVLCHMKEREWSDLHHGFVDFCFICTNCFGWHPKYYSCYLIEIKRDKL